MRWKVIYSKRWLLLYIMLFVAPTSSFGGPEEYSLLKIFIANGVPIGTGLKEDITEEYFNIFPKERTMNFYSTYVLHKVGFTEIKENSLDHKIFEYSYITSIFCKKKLFLDFYLSQRRIIKVFKSSRNVCL